MSDKNFPPSASDTSKTILQATTLKGDPGEPAVIAIPYPAAAAVLCDNDGSNPQLPEVVSVAIIEGNELLADMSSSNGWSVSVESTSSCTVSQFSTTIGVQFTAVTADRGYAVLKHSKTGYDDIYSRVYYFKAYQGEKGDQGDQGDKGDTGATGSQGPQGDPGTGLVVVKKTITVDALASRNLNNMQAYDNSGLAFKTYGGNHGYSLGEHIHHENFTNSSYNGDFVISEIVDSTEYRITGPTYISYDSGDSWPWERFSKNMSDTDGPQDLWFKNIIPEDGGILLGLNLVMITDAEEYIPLTCYVGYDQYNATGWNAYMNGIAFYDEGQQQKWPTSQFVHNAMNTSFNSQFLTDIWLRAVPTVNKSWSIKYLNCKFNLFVFYISCSLDTLGS